MRTITRAFLHLLYQPLAFAYDLVSSIVSFGHWKSWTMEVVPFITGNRVLELGHGPGHLQRFLLDRNLSSFALDESPQMGRLARRNTGRAGRFVRAKAQQLPFSAGEFDTVIATFPTEYFYDIKTLDEVRRCLVDGGRYIVLPAAFPSRRFLYWLYMVTGENPQEFSDALMERFGNFFPSSNFSLEMQVLKRKSGRLLIIIATKI